MVVRKFQIFSRRKYEWEKLATILLPAQRPILPSLGTIRPQELQKFPQYRVLESPADLRTFCPAGSSILSEHGKY
jgi:hypothetical protein